MFKSLLRASGSLILVSSAVAAQAQDRVDPAMPANAATPDKTGEPATGTDENGEIVVTGSYARSLRAATETKRRADYGVDSINSTDIGKFRRRTSPRRCR